MVFRSNEEIFNRLERGWSKGFQPVSAPNPSAAIAKKPKKDKKTYLLIYSDSDTITIERLTKKEIREKIKQLALEDDEFTVIAGKIKTLRPGAER